MNADTLEELSQRLDAQAGLLEIMGGGNHRRRPAP